MNHPVANLIATMFGRQGWRVLVLSAMGALAASPALAQDAETVIDPETVPAAELEPASQQASSSLQTVLDTMELNEERITQIRAEIEALDGDATQLGLELTAAAQRIDLASEDIRIVEERLEELFASERDIRVRLDGHDRSISNLLASLQRITAQPPPVIIVDPADALGSARAAMLLSSVLPQLQEKADTVTADLNALVALKQDAEAEADHLRANLGVLNEERLRIATIIEARKQGIEWLSEDLLLEEAEARALADRATSLEQLIAGLQTRLDAVTAADEAMQAANSGRTVPTLDPETLRMAFADTSRTEPAVPLEAAKGYLVAPLAGPLITAFGAADGFGGSTKGVLIDAEPGEPVVAPADGWISYAGLFLNYGQIIILNAGQNYMVVLAGLGDISVQAGQFVQMGTTLGTIGPDAPLAEQRPGLNGPALYIELREGEIPIDPQGWWTARTDEQQESGTN